MQHKKVTDFPYEIKVGDIIEKSTSWSPIITYIIEDNGTHVVDSHFYVYEKIATCKYATENKELTGDRGVSMDGGPQIREYIKILK